MKSTNRTHYTHWNYATSVAEFIRSLGSFLDKRVVWDADLPTIPKFHWYLHDLQPLFTTVEQRTAARDPEKVLANVTEQTGLTFKKEKRKVQVLYVSVPEKKEK